MPAKRLPIHAQFKPAAGCHETHLRSLARASALLLRGRERRLLEVEKIRLPESQEPERPEENK
ncbi:hypothetical protein [Armatimonas sp.]|uniref:hypothetical protein n=1 Tax=Armatimonas sp. TaxID=1872638 RepID=UPI00286BCEEA|nr:hypothetical protein [Armatimonas sp.]